MVTKQETENEREGKYRDRIEAVNYLTSQIGGHAGVIWQDYSLNSYLLTQGKTDSSVEKIERDSLVLVWKNKSSWFYRVITTKGRIEKSHEHSPYKTRVTGREETLWCIRSYSNEEEKELFNLGWLTPSSFYQINEVTDDTNEIKISYGTGGYNRSLADFRISKKEMGLESVLEDQTHIRAPVEGDKPLQQEGRKM